MSHLRLRGSQTTKAANPHTEEHITGSSFPIHSENYFVFYLDSQVSSKRRFYTSTIISRGDIGTVRQSQPNVSTRSCPNYVFCRLKSIAQMNPLFRSQTTNSSINMAVENVFDTPDELVDFVAVSLPEKPTNSLI